MKYNNMTNRHFALDKVFSMLIILSVSIFLYGLNDDLDGQIFNYFEMHGTDIERELSAEMQQVEHKEHKQEIRANRTLDTELVIITADSLEAEFEEFAQIKNEEGIVTEVFTLTATGTTSSAIRSWLDTQKTANANLQYVIIGGDEDIVPSHQIIYEHADSILTASTDFYYSNVLSDWPQYDDDTINIETDIDLYVGRVPVRNSDDVEVFITKYENYRINYTNYTDRMGFIATNISKTPNSTIQDRVISDFISKTGDDIECDSLYASSLIDTVNGPAEAVLDMFRARNYSFLYGMWHGIDRFVILDSEFDGEDTWPVMNFGKHKQNITFLDQSVEEGGCYYSECVMPAGHAHEGEYSYTYTSPESSYRSLED